MEKFDGSWMIISMEITYQKANVHFEKVFYSKNCRKKEQNNLLIFLHEQYCGLSVIFDTSDLLATNDVDVYTFDIWSEYVWFTITHNYEQRIKLG